MTPEQLHAILESPALKPPEGVVPNFVDPENLSNNPLTISLLIISTLFVFARLYSKFLIVKKPVLEDYILLLAWLIYAIPFHIYIFKIHSLPNGIHQWNLKVKDLVRCIKLYHYAQILYALSIVPLKTAIILQYLRVFVPPGVRDLTFWACWTLICSNMIFYFTLIIIEAFSCSPMEAIWDVTIEGKCLDRHSFHLMTATINSASDICILILPQRHIWALEGMKRTRKWCLSSLFFVGASACVFALIRLYYTVLLYLSDDLSYYIAKGNIWVEPEVMCGFVAASAPMIPRFLNHIFSKKIWKHINGTFQRLLGGKSDSSNREVHEKAQRPQKEPRELISDIEFHDLVIETNKTESESNGTEQEQIRTGFQTPANCT